MPDNPAGYPASGKENLIRPDPNFYFLLIVLKFLDDKIWTTMVLDGNQEIQEIVNLLKNYQEEIDGADPGADEGDPGADGGDPDSDGEDSGSNGADPGSDGEDSRSKGADPGAIEAGEGSE